MTCDHRFLDEPTGLRCTRADAHPADAPGGHSYAASAGPDLARAEVTDD